MDSDRDVEAPGTFLPDYAIPAQRRGELLKVAKERGAITVAESASQFAEVFAAIKELIAPRATPRRRIDFNP